MKITDGKKTVDIRIQRWNDHYYDPDWSADYFNAGSLPYDEETNTYTVDSVDSCIEYANSASEDGACSKYDEESGEYIRDEDMFVFVDEL